MPGSSQNATSARLTSVACKGYASEASRAVLKRAFEIHRLEQVLAITDFPNKASVRVMERLGMQFVERSIANGLETLTYAISREQFVQDAAER